MPHIRSGAYLGVVFLLAAGCADPVTRGDIHDPFEPTNRKIHGANKTLDRALLRPAANEYGHLPPELRQGASNFADNLSVPGTVVNDLLQFHIEDAIHNTLRFAINTTVGLGGLWDPASKAGIEPRPSDFGETLHVWGFGEGAYVELPLLGPSTTRDTVGIVADIFLDPMGNILPADAQWLIPASFVTNKLNDRASFSQTVDSVLYESEDSYAQTRLFYLESRRFQLGGADEAEDELYDLYEEALE